MINSLNKSRTLKLVLKCILLDLADLVVAEIFTKPHSHLINLLLLGLILRFSSGLKRQQLLVEFISGHDFDTREIFRRLFFFLSRSFNFIVDNVTVLFILTLLNSLPSEAISNISHNDEHEEESKS